MNWRIDEDSDIGNLQNIGDGFLLSAIDLAKRCLTDNDHKEADILIFPIFNNANHGIELYLKVLNLLFSKLLNLEVKIDKSHNIQKLFESVKAKAKDYKGNFSFKDFKDSTKNLESYIDELFKMIKPVTKNDRMDFSRYPFTNNHENHFYVNSFGKSFEIDLLRGRWRLPRSRR